MATTYLPEAEAPSIICECTIVNVPPAPQPGTKENARCFVPNSNALLFMMFIQSVQRSMPRISTKAEIYAA